MKYYSINSGKTTIYGRIDEGMGVVLEIHPYANRIDKEKSADAVNRKMKFFTGEKNKHASVITEEEFMAAFNVMATQLKNNISYPEHARFVVSALEKTEEYCVECGSKTIFKGPSFNDSFYHDRMRFCGKCKIQYSVCDKEKIHESYSINTDMEFGVDFLK